MNSRVFFKKNCSLRKLCCLFRISYFLKQVFTYVKLVVVDVLVVLHGGQRRSEKVEEGGSITVEKVYIHVFVCGKTSGRIEGLQNTFYD